MEWAIGHIIEQYVKDRSVVILGEGYNLLRWFPIIKAEVEVSRVIASLADGIDVGREYLVICEDRYVDHREQLGNLEMEEIRDYYPWTKYARTNGHLPIDVDYHGVTIGYGSYFPYSKDMMKHIGGIGRFCSIASSAMIQGNHSMNRITTSSLYPMLSEQARRVVSQAPTDKDPLGTNRKVLIGNDVWIGANAFINASLCSKIGDGAIIGTNSLVLSDVPPYAIVYGSPAKVQRYRFSPEQIEVLLKTNWWDWEQSFLEKNIDMLMDPNLFFEAYGRRQ